ncbi:MAG: DSD1 family PLP-dependent enzyme [Anaerolineae bacterium]
MESNNLIGKSLDAVDTPALLVDLDALEHNLATMAAFFAARPADLRPHFKTHKCLEIARLQLAHGARGFTCAKLGEAEVLVRAGFDDILLANQVVGALKIERLMALAAQARMTVAVDDAVNAQALAAAARTAGVRLRVLVEVDLGMHRCGVAPGQPALALARAVAAEPALHLAGLMGYEGHLVLTKDPSERRAKVEAAFARLLDTKDLIEREGLHLEVISGGGTGTYDIAGAYPGVTEVQAGSYVFMDRTYAAVRPEFRRALSILSTVISRPSADRLVLDAGLKAVSGEFGPPEAPGLAANDDIRLSEEHARLTLEAPARVHLRPGDRVALIPSHCCTTVNLHDRLVAVRSGVIEAVWPVAARGRST